MYAFVNPSKDWGKSVVLIDIAMEKFALKCTHCVILPKSMQSVEDGFDEYVYISRLISG